MQQILRNISLCLTAIFLIPHPVEAQQMAARADAGRATTETLQSPDIQTQTKSKRWTPKNWLEIEGAIKVETRPEPPSGMLDRLIVKWYVAVPNPDKNGDFFLLTREITHVNVPVGDEFYSSVYLSPSSVRRIAGSDRAGDRAVHSIGYEVIFNGEVIASGVGRGSRDQWWTAASERISASDSIPLMTKPETPFAAMWWDRYAEVAVER